MRVALKSLNISMAICQNILSDNFYVHSGFNAMVNIKSLRAVYENVIKATKTILDEKVTKLR